ncbi:MAG: SIMPL domain-containing protein [Candidatus Nanoarchaeia archaeon]|nr:SIMPL domain-containing protein [Candidatus Nanoarchaeia archaeon]MDD5357956.1 SIMPL domain-containing protein [Candidatus Nanoarchaeia archaeon]MDD5588875.1 SIMPL domain-containing protein [Candidatus Nanoarchaeia archaeon]
MPRKKLKLHKSVQMTLIIVAAVLFISLAGMYFYKSNFSTANTISVSGQGVEKAAPDLISIYFNVDTTGSTSKIAEDANTAIVTKLKSYIVALGFSDDDLKTDNYNIYPEYDYDKTTPTITGYRATHSLKISFSASESDKITSVIDSGTNAGAGISYINFELSPELEQEYKAMAIQTASEDAKIKAEAIAEGFNKRLGRLVSVSLDSYNYYPLRAYDSSVSGTSAESAKTAVAGITPSEREVTAYVTAIYKLG